MRAGFLLLLFIVPFFFSFNIEMKVEKLEEETPNADLCPTCIQVMGETINELLNIILNVGVIGECGTLCEYLEPKFGQIVAVACDLICDYVGIELFIKLIEKADLDPIWLCQEIKMCEVHDCKLKECAKFLEPTKVIPNPFHLNDEVSFVYKFEAYEQTGTGEILLAIWTSPHSFPPILDFSELVSKGYEKGIFTLTLKVTMKDDPGAEFPIIFKPGEYRAHLHLCEGMCESKHPHSRLLAEQYGNFTMAE